MIYQACGANIRIILSAVRRLAGLKLKDSREVLRSGGETCASSNRGHIMTFYIEMLYPERRMVSEDYIRSWYSDLLADGKIEMPDHEVDLWEAIDVLMDIGVATFGKFTQERKT
jgi:hypothetical protein